MANQSGKSNPWDEFDKDLTEDDSEIVSEEEEREINVSLWPSQKTIGQLT